MNRLIFTMVLAASVFLIPAFAVEEHHPDKPRSPAKTESDDKVPGAKQSGMQMGTMQDSMLKMHEQMHQIMQTSDPREREKLMQEHRRMMHDHMEMMGGMMGSGMMTGDKMARGKTGPASGPMERRMQMMERRMDAMQMTIEQMQKH